MSELAVCTSLRCLISVPDQFECVYLTSRHPPQVLGLLKSAMEQTADQHLELRAVATECAGAVAKAASGAPVAAKTVNAFEADYVILGGGMTGTGIAAELLDYRKSKSIIILDRLEKLGGHWLYAYPYVHLHNFTSYYTLYGYRWPEHIEKDLEHRASMAMDRRCVISPHLAPSRHISPAHFPLGCPVQALSHTRPDGHGAQQRPR